MDAAIEQNTKLWESVKHEENLKAAFPMAIDLAELFVRQSLLDRCELRKELLKIRKESHEESQELKIHILGNGDPSKGIKARLERIETLMTEQKEKKDKFLWILVPIMITQILTLILNFLF